MSRESKVIFTGHDFPFTVDSFFFPANGESLNIYVGERCFVLRKEACSWRRTCQDRVIVVNNWELSLLLDFDAFFRRLSCFKRNV